MRLPAPIVFISTLVIMGCVVLYSCNSTNPPAPAGAPKADDGKWEAPSVYSLGNTPHDSLILYGRELIAHTSLYLGPNGSVAHISNGMNCQNCHLEAGTKLYGNNYSAVASTYPKFRERSGGMENIYKRVNDCLERSLNGKALDTLSHEMQAIKAYIEWVGKDVKKGVKPEGAGIIDLPFMGRAADPAKGKLVYDAKCMSCHAADGQGKMKKDTAMYEYPPLWGPHSYNIGAGLYRVSRFAGYVKLNMPFGTTTMEEPTLSDEEAWDVAAFVNSQPHPKKDLKADFPNKAGKPVDNPFGPYADAFSEKQHKYGPFGEIVEFKKKNANK